MERLTIKQDGEYYMKTLNDDCIVCASCEKCEKHINQLVKILGAYEDTGLTPEEIEQNKEYIQILEKENKLIKEQYIKEADTVDCYKKLATENAKLKELIKELGWKYENR